VNNTKYITILRHAVYCLLFLILYVVQTVPGLFVIRGIKPIWVIPAAIALAMFEGEFIGGIYGAAAGLLCDIGGFLLFGFNGFLTCVYCIAVGLLVIYLMRCNMLGCMMFVFIFMLLRGSLEFLFLYGMWGYDDVWRIYVNQTLPTVLFSTLISPIVFYSMRGVFRRFERVLKDQ
jgi:cell shape-determining protein MreD